MREDPNSTSSGEWGRQRRRIRMRNGREKLSGPLLPCFEDTSKQRGGDLIIRRKKTAPVSLAPDNLSRGLRPFQPFHSAPIFSTPIIIVLDFFQVLFICRIRRRRQETVGGRGFLRAVFLPSFFSLATFPRGPYKVLQSRIF